VRAKIAADIRAVAKDPAIVQKLTATAQIVSPGDAAEFVQSASDCNRSRAAQLKHAAATAAKIKNAIEAFGIDVDLLQRRADAFGGDFAGFDEPFDIRRTRNQFDDAERRNEDVLLSISVADRRIFQARARIKPPANPGA
jgi:hypothetical protein